MKWFRPAITLLGSLSVYLAFFLDKISAEAFMGFIGVTAIYWFKSRDSEKERGKQE